MGRKTFLRILGLFAILSTLGYVLTLNQSNRVIYGWSGLIATVLAGPAYVGVYLFLKNPQNENLSRWGLLFMMAGLSLVAGIYVIAYIEALFGVDVYGGTADAINMATINGGSVLTFGISGLLYSLASMRDTAVPRWHQLLGVIAALLGITWIFFFWAPGFAPGQIGFFIPVAGMILSLIWQLFLGIFMIREK